MSSSPPSSPPSSTDAETSAELPGPVPVTIVAEEKPEEPSPQHAQAARALSSASTASAARSYERWIILACTSTGIFLASMQSSSLVIAFPQLVADLNADIYTIMWVLMSFLLVTGAFTTTTSKLGAIFGQTNVFKAGYVVFAISSLLSGFSQPNCHAYDLLAYRCIMGISATFLFTNSSTILTSAFLPYNQLGVATGVLQLCNNLGAILGPVIGGAFAVTDWRWIFWLNVPLAGIASIFSIIYIREHRGADADKTRTWKQSLHDFDFIGVVFVFGFAVLLMMALTQAAIPTPPLNAPLGIALLTVFSFVSIVLFFLNEKYLAKDPLMDTSIFLNIKYDIAIIATTAAGFTRSNITYGLIFFFQGPCGDDPLTAGYKLIPYGIGVILTGFISGFISDKIGVRKPAVAGPIISCFGCLGLALVTRDTNFWLNAFAQFVAGLGLGIFNSPSGVAVMLTVPAKHRGIAPAIRQLLSMLFMMIGIVITFSLIVNTLDETELITLFIYGGSHLEDAAVTSLTDSLHILFYICIGSNLVASAASLLIPGDLAQMARDHAAARKPKPIENSQPEGQVSAEAHQVEEGKKETDGSDIELKETAPTTSAVDGSDKV